jgi:hypothetical protein
MNVLVATMKTQGQWENDFAYVPEGELVARYSMICAAEREDGSGCGCGRSFGGFTTHGSTTSAIVEARDMTEAQWRAQMHDVLFATGWGEWLSSNDLADIIDELVFFDLESIQALAPGTVLGRRAWNMSDGLVHDELRIRYSPTGLRAGSPLDC